MEILLPVLGFAVGYVVCYIHMTYGVDQGE